MNSKPYWSSGRVEKNGEPSSEWMDGGTDVVRKARKRQFSRACAAADGWIGFIDRTDLPARASSMAAAKPFGPAPIMIASTLVLLAYACFSVQPRCSLCLCG